MEFVSAVTVGMLYNTFIHPILAFIPVKEFRRIVHQIFFFS